MQQTALDTTAFRDGLARDGYTEVLTREWAPSAAAPSHSHPFDARLLVLRGEMTLTRHDGSARVMRPGDECEVPRDETHAEVYGAEGATLLVGRRG